MRGIVVLLVLALLSAAPVPAQTRQSSIGVQVSAGLSGATGELADGTDIGAAGQLGIRFKPAPNTSPELDLALIGGLHHFPASQDTSQDINIVLAGLEARLEMNAYSQTKWYLIGGGGFARAELGEYVVHDAVGGGDTVARTIPSRTENNTYITVGAGVEFGGSKKVRFFIEGRVLNVFGTIIKNYTMVPAMIGIRF
jgi:hypothetical protein